MSSKLENQMHLDIIVYGTYTGPDRDHDIFF